MKTVHELEDLSDLEAIAEDYEAQYGAPPFDVSHWNPSNETLHALLKYLRIPSSSVVGPYIYSQDLDSERRKVVERLGFSSKEMECLVVPTGTSATPFAVWWMKACCVKRTIVLCPAYFPVFYACEMVDLPFVPIYLRRHAGGWELPVADIEAALGGSRSNVGLWVTNPIYSTGSPLQLRDVQFVDSLLAQGVFVVADECLSPSGRELGRRLNHKRRFLGIYSPHKSVSINAIKFAAMIFDSSYLDFFGDWADILIGGLGVSTYLALSHFLGDNFVKFQSAFASRIGDARQLVSEMVREHAPAVELDTQSEGYFVTCYAPHLPARPSLSSFLRPLVFETGAILIPGARNHFGPDIGFNFRINLARACPEFFAALRRILNYLSGSRFEG